VAVKFGRNYILKAQTQDGSILTIEPPFTIEFDITRNTFSSLNIASIRIYNLSKNNRNNLRKDVTDYNSFRSIELAAGYGNALSIIFKGNITQAWSVREGVDFVTQIESFDGGFAAQNGFTNLPPFPAGTSEFTVIATLAQSLPKLSLGAVSQKLFTGTLSRGNAYNGNTLNILKQNWPNTVFIDNGKVNCLGNTECLLGQIPIIDSSNGLLETPVLEQTILNFNMIFEPGLIVGQYLQLKSLTAPAQFNNSAYKVISLKHRGTISSAICGNAITSVGMTNGGPALTIVPQAVL